MKIQLLGFQYEVFADENELAKTCDEYEIDSNITYGLHVAEERKILVSPNLSDTQFVQTLFHELLHAIGSISGHAELAHSSRKAEYFVDAIANGILSALQNPELYLFVGMKLGHLKKEE